jgi:hypothetical protein
MALAATMAVYHHQMDMAIGVTMEAVNNMQERSLFRRGCEECKQINLNPRNQKLK